MPSEHDGWRFCPRCAGPLEVADGAAACAACGLVHFAAPAPAICAIVEDGEGRLLLGRRAREPFAGRWDVLGGFMQEGEQPLDTLRRELREETGLETEPGDFLAAISDTYGEGGHTLNVCWIARALGGELRAADDVAELRWFAPEELPPLEELAFANAAELVRLWLVRRRGETTG
jgi:ADP-ribose pyrophosphatase YjhB (NUDIX family)